MKNKVLVLVLTLCLSPTFAHALNIYSDKTAVVTPATDDVIGIEQSRVTKRISLGQIRDFTLTAGMDADRTCKTMMNPVDADSIYFDIGGAAWTVGSIKAFASGGSSVVYTIQECTSAGASCAGIHDAHTVTSDAAASAATVTDDAIASSAVLKLDIGTVTGDVQQLVVCIFPAL